jgi:hypothetical protein
MNITSPLLKGASQLASLPGDSVSSFLTMIGNATGLFDDGPDGGLGILMSALAGAGAALAVAIALSAYFRSGTRTTRDVLKHGIAAVVVLGLAAFVAYDMRHAALTYLGINPEKPAVEFEIRMPKAAMSAISDSQIELHTDRNQSLAQVQGAADFDDRSGVLRGTVRLDYRTTDRIMVLNLPGRAQCEFKLRLAADPSRSAQFGPWHLADRVALSSSGDAALTDAHSSFAIRYRVL